MFHIELSGCLFSYASESDAVEQLMLLFKDKIQVLNEGTPHVLNDNENETWKTFLACQDKTPTGYFKVYQTDDGFSNNKKERKECKIYLKDIIYPELKRFAEKTYQSLSEIKTDANRLEYFLCSKHEEFIFYQILFEFKIFDENCYMEQSIVETLENKRKKAKENEPKKNI